MNTNYNGEAFVRSLEKLSLQGRMRNVKEAFPAESITPKADGANAEHLF